MFDDVKLVPGAAVKTAGVGAVAVQLYDLVCWNTGNLMQIVDVTVKEGEITGKLDLDDQILATPAVANGAIYVRSNTKIYKVAK